MSKFWIFLLFSSLFGQVIDWSEKPDPITAIQIFCDTDGIPIYVDGIQVGASPIKETIQVAPGWHQVSYFPPNMSIDTGSMNQNRKMRDLIQMYHGVPFKTIPVGKIRSSLGYLEQFFTVIDNKKLYKPKELIHTL